MPRLLLLMALLAAPACALERPHHAGWLRAGARVDPARAVAVHRSAAAALDAVRRALPAGVTLTERPADGLPRRVLDQAANGRRVVNGVLTVSDSGRSALTVGHPVRASARDAGGHAISPEAARVAALAHVGVRRPARPAVCEPVWLDRGDALVPAFEVTVQAWAPPVDARVVLDAASGAVLRADDLAGAVDGEASVYRTHPLDGAPGVEKITDLLEGGRLQGRFVSVENSAGIDASSSNNRFVYPPSNPHLDESNVYWHVSRVHDLFAKTLGWTGLDDAPIAAGVHYGENLDNAYYIPWAHCIVFGDGGRYNVLSRDASVAYHEYTHAVTTKVAGLGSVGAAAALSEGFSDYYAASLADEPRIAVWTVAKIGKPYLRTVANALHVPEDLKNESHHDSQIWSGLLWDLRKTLGRDAVDRLAFRSLAALNSEASFAQAVQALVGADEALNGGANAAAIRAAAAARGIAPAGTVLE